MSQRAARMEKIIRKIAKLRLLPDLSLSSPAQNSVGESSAHGGTSNRESVSFTWLRFQASSIASNALSYRAESRDRITS